MGDPMEWQEFHEQISFLSILGIAISFMEPYIYTSEWDATTYNLTDEKLALLMYTPIIYTYMN